MPELLEAVIGRPVREIEGRPENRLAEGIAPMSSTEPPTTVPAVGLLADGAYPSRKNIKKCADLGIQPLMNMRTDLTAGGKGTGDAWGMAVRHQLGGSPGAKIGRLATGEREENKAYWRGTVGYGRRWGIERLISALKRIFGEHLMSVTWDNMVREVMMRVTVYNEWLDEEAEVAAAAAA